jgi:hypothetical protein
MFIKFHGPTPRNVALAPFLLQQPLSGLEIYRLLVPAEVCAQEDAKVFLKEWINHKMLVCMQHNVKILKKVIFLKWRCFYFSKY